MAFDQATRNRLARFVSDTRSLLAEEFTRQLQNVYGLDPDTGDVTDPARLTLDNAQRETARLLRETMEHYLASADTSTAAKAKKARQATLDRIVREQAFTVLNRLCALRMAEARGLLIESLAKGYQSKGFQLYHRLSGTALGEMGNAYRAFLFSVFDEFAVDLPVLFDRFSPQGRLFPRETALLAVLSEINHADIDPFWAEDETIGWIYQYFNSVDERRQMRSESAAPRNSRELAVRNQFFTPRYVVEFLTDNTLGRIWYEMTQGETTLKDSCRYLVRRPNEIFLAEGEEAPEQEELAEDLSQDEMLKPPIHIPRRPLKDPRDIKMLDPACGSMHFGLYAFDLFEGIYDEAWDLEAERGADAIVRPEGLKPLHNTYDSKDAFLRDVPRLIIERNIHGIDIDPRAVQIAGLSLWLRAQRSWQTQGVASGGRPQIQRSNIVCAEPMPGEADMLEEFLKGLRDDRLESLICRVLDVPENQQVRATARMAEALCDLVRTVWKEMELAGESGSLLKIEESLADAIAKGKEEWVEKAPLFRVMEFGLTDETQANPKVKYYKSVPGEQEDFWNRAEAMVLAALHDYAEQAQGSDASRRRMFAEDASRGFAFIDLFRTSFDVALMNPPFGLVPAGQKGLFKKLFPDDWTEIYACFIARMLDLTFARAGMVGAITSSLWLYTKHQHSLRQRLLSDAHLHCFADLGGGVLDDATVDTGLLVASSRWSGGKHVIYYRDVHASLQHEHDCLLSDDRWEPRPASLYRALPLQPFCFHVDIPKLALWSGHKQLEPSIATVVTGNSTFDNFRFLRLHVEVGRSYKSGEWIAYDKGGHYQPFFNPTPLLWRFSDGARENRAFQIGKYGTDAQVQQSRSSWMKSGLCYSRATSIGFSPRVLPSNSVMNEKSISVFCHYADDVSPLLGLLASTHVQDLLDVFGRHRNIENRAVGGLPFDRDLLTPHRSSLHRLAARGITWAWMLESRMETSRVFTRPPLPGEASLALEGLARLSSELDHVVSQILYAEDRDPESPKRATLAVNHLSKRFNWDAENTVGEAWRSFVVGVAFARWLPIMDSCPQMAEEAIVDACLGPLPDNPPALDLTGQAVLVLVDDRGHSSDVAAACENAAELCAAVCPDAVGIWAEVDWRAWLRKSFFAEHLTTYTIAARSAPIYWPLSTPSNSYTIWVYYNGLTDQTLYTCVNDFVEPKLKQVSEEASRLRGKSNRSSAEEKELERLSDLELELKDFRDELLRIAKFWKPNLNDGVQITAAPLWKLFQHRQWQNRLKETWEKLEAGDYDWAHLALSIWPDRVVRASHKDRSYAIAHDLEDHLWHEVEVRKTGRGGRVTTKLEWRPRELSEMELKGIVAEVKQRPQRVRA
jgi:hypothetical protein